MISNEIVKECLDILELIYNEHDDGAISVSFNEMEEFPHAITTVIRVQDENFVIFDSYAEDYHPDGDLLELANRHNTRFFSPACYIDSDQDVVMHRTFIINDEVSPAFILNDVIKPGVYLANDAFLNFELSDSQIEEKRNRH